MACYRQGQSGIGPSRWRNEGVEIPAWVHKHLGLLLELQRLHAEYWCHPAPRATTERKPLLRGWAFARLLACIGCPGDGS